MTPLLRTASEYVERNLSPIPVRADGSKAPAFEGWRDYAERRATAEELRGWFGNGKIIGVGIACGSASGNLVVLDIESSDAWAQWRAGIGADTADFLDQCPIVRTPRGGRHVWCRLQGPMSGHVLARFADKKVKIEIRGAGHQVLAPGCPPQCHPSGKLYEFEQRGWLDGGDCPTIPGGVFMEWCSRARSLTEYHEPRRDRGTAPSGEDDVFAAFNRAQTPESVKAILTRAGWEYIGQRGERWDFRRPGKTDGLSGDLAIVDGMPLFYSFTTSTDLPADCGLNPSHLRCRLEFGGHFAKLAEKLRDEGFGTKTPKATIGSATGPQPSTSGTAGKNSPLPQIDFPEITASLDTADFVEGLLLDGAMSVIYGDSNTGKSFFALDLALSVAGGTPWRGRDVEPGGVLYLALEGSVGIRNRVAAYKLDRQCAHAPLPFAVVPVAVDLCSLHADTNRVIEACKVAAEKMGMPVRLIVVDTLARAMAGGNENSPEDMGALVSHCGRIQQTVGTHLMLIHHSGKDGARGARGHSSLRAATDTELEITREEGSKNSRVRVSKQRDMEIDEEFGFSLAQIVLGKNRRGKPVTSCVVREAFVQKRDRTLPPGQQIALTLLTEVIAEAGKPGFGAPEGVVSVPEAWWRDRVYQRTKPGDSQDSKKRSFRRAADGLVEAGRVAVQDERVWIPDGTKRDKAGHVPP